VFINICGLPADGEGVSRLCLSWRSSPESSMVCSPYTYSQASFQPTRGQDRETRAVQKWRVTGPIGESGAGHPAVFTVEAVQWVGQFL
jgi:hypothetical protein